MQRLEAECLEILGKIVFARCADFGHVRVSETRPETVRAGEQHIAGLERQLCRDAHIRHRRIATKAAFDKIAHRVVLRLFFADRAFLDQHLYMAVIPRTAQDATVSYLVNAAVTNMRPKGAAFLNETDGAGCTRSKINGNVVPKGDNGVVRPRQNHIQKALRIKYWQTGPGKQVLNDLERCFGGSRTVRMPAHAIKYQHHGSLFGDHDCGAVLIVLTVPKSRDFRVFNVHGVSFCLVSL